MNFLIKNINSVESHWLDRLYQYCQTQFSTVKIPSHDDLHHLRVWKLAKELMIELNESGVTFSAKEIEQIIIAIFFHDIGMVETIDKKHGLAGKIICEEYFRKNVPDFKGDLNTILDTIEKHDDKEYKSMVYHGDMHKHILSILCVCDDLDAFGAIGVFRYMEIYMLRGMKVAELAPAILQNIESRYNNFHQLYSHLHDFHDKQTQNYKFIKNFYIRLQEEVQGKSDNDSGANGVLNFFIDGILKGSETINTISDYALANSDDIYVSEFFHQFRKDVTQ